MSDTKIWLHDAYVYVMSNTGSHGLYTHGSYDPLRRAMLLAVANGFPANTLVCVVHDWLIEQGYDDLVSVVGDELVTRGNDTLMGVLDPKGEDFFYEVSTAPKGEWGPWEPFGDTDRRHRSATRTLLCVHPNAREVSRKSPFNSALVLDDESSLEVGSIVTCTVARYYSETDSKNVGHDFCAYCGADNGSSGELWVGYDCVQCGSN